MSDFIFDRSQIVASNEQISQCPISNSSPGDKLQIDTEKVELTPFADTFVHRRREVAAVIGPIVCDGCDHGCQDAYVTLDSSELASLVLDDDLNIAATPVNIRLLGRTVSRPTALQKHYASDLPLRQFGWDNRCRNEITNDLIDLTLAAGLIGNPDGGVALQQALPTLSVDC